MKFIASTLALVLLGSNVAIGEDSLRGTASRQLKNPNGVGANQGDSKVTPRGKKVQCDESDFSDFDDGTKTLQEIGSTALCGQEVDSCLWYIGLREIDCECGVNAGLEFDTPCPEPGTEYCPPGFTLTKGVSNTDKNGKGSSFSFWVCDLN